MELAKLELLNFLEEDSKFKVGVIHCDVINNKDYVQLESMTGMDYKPIIEGNEDLILNMDDKYYFPHDKFSKLQKQKQSSNCTVVYIYFEDFSNKSIQKEQF